MADAAGLQGAVDFVGYPVGQTQPANVPNVPTAGFYGLIDFVGYPVAQGAVSPARRGHLVFGVGRQVAQMMYESVAQQQNSILLRQRLLRAESARRMLRNRQMTHTLAEIREERSVNAAVGAAFLSEI